MTAPGAMSGFLVGATGMFATMYSTQAILPELSKTFGVPPSRAGLSVSVVVLMLAAGSWLWGPVSDRIGRRRPTSRKCSPPEPVGGPWVPMLRLW